MTLHLGSVPPLVRKNELEHVLGRFGQCTVRMFDGYAFADYDFRGDADKALRSLKGRKICGESIHLSWAKKQPKLDQGCVRVARDRDVQYGRGPVRGDSYANNHNYSKTRCDKVLNDVGGKHKSAGLRDDIGRFNHVNQGRSKYDQREDMEDGGHDEPRQVANGRSAVEVDDQNGYDLDAQMRFDRYEPDYVDERGEHKNYAVEHFPNSSTREMIPEKNRRVRHVDNARGVHTCYKCGAAGHKMRDCPAGDDFHRKNSHPTDRSHDSDTDKKTRGRDESRGRESKSIGMSQPSSSYSRSTRQRGVDGKPFHVDNNELNGKNFPVSNECERDKRKGYKRKRRREREDHTVETHDAKKSRMLALPRHSGRTTPELGTHPGSIKPLSNSRCHSRSSSPKPYSRSGSPISPELGKHPRSMKPLSDLRCHSRSPLPIPYSRSGSPISPELGTHSRSIKPLSDSRCHSRSRSPAPNSHSGSPISESKLTRSRSRSARSRSRFRSLSSSLSISAGQSLPSPKNLNGSYGGSPTQSKVTSREVRHYCELEVRGHNPSVSNMVEPCVSKCMDDTRSDQLQEVLVGEQLEPDSKSEIPKGSMYTEVSLNGFVEDDQIGLSEAVRDRREHLQTESMQDCVQSQDVSFPSSVKSKIEKLHCDGCSNSTVDPVSCEVEVLCPHLVEHGNMDSIAGEIAAEKLNQNVELQNGNALEMEKSLELVNKSDLIAPSKRLVGSHLSISTEELYRVLKHYGLELPKEDERHLGVEDYFGSARLWPWEMVYYRRLKKGPISIENYAKRVAQNEAFGISDKYIRSSSGWGELTEEYN